MKKILLYTLCLFLISPHFSLCHGAHDDIPPSDLRHSAPVAGRSTHIPRLAPTIQEPPIAFAISIGGGGSRGIVPAMLLAEIETQLGMHASDLFHYWGGTSTGSLVVGGALATTPEGLPRYKAQDICNLYRHKAPLVFQTPAPRSLYSLWGLRQVKYAEGPLISLLSSTFGDIPLWSVRRPMTLMTWDGLRRQPAPLASWDPQQFSHLPFCIAAQASCSAPGFFSPTAVSSPNGNTTLLSDGFFCGLNPMGRTYRDTKALYPRARVCLLSLDTGFRGEEDYDPDHYRSMGLFHWMPKMVHDLSDGHVLENVTQMRRKLNRPEKPRRFFHFSPTLEAAHADFDDTSPATQTYLESKAREIIASEDFTALIQTLKETRPRYAPFLNGRGRLPAPLKLASPLTSRRSH